MQVWKDLRSGEAGKLLGNFVLGALVADEDIAWTREKGTIFSTPAKIVVGRVNASCNYLQGGKHSVIHFCNMSERQSKLIKSIAPEKKAFCLFITGGYPTAKEISFWLVPLEIVMEVLKGLPVKRGTNTVHMRIGMIDDDHILGWPHGETSRRINRYHHAVSVSPQVLSRLKHIAQSHDSVKVSADIEGRSYVGTLKPSSRKTKRHVKMLVVAN